MTIVRWEPLRELGSLQSEMNRLFDAAFDPSVPASGQPRRWTPAMDLIETPDHFVLRADLPGVSQSDVAVELEDNVLTISGERKRDHDGESQGHHRVERAYGAFSRSLTLPRGIDAEAVNAAFEGGVLTIRVPKPEQRKPRKIAIGDNAPQTLEGAAA